MDVRKGVKSFDRFRIQYRLYGNKGPVIICVNGAYQTMMVWHSFVKYFLKDYRILIFDYPGQGKSEICSVPFVVTFEEQVRILGEMVEMAENIHDVYLFGLSWGGVVAAAYTAEHKNKIKKLLLASFLVRPNGKLRDIISRGKTMVYNGEHKEISDLMINEFGQGLPDSIKRQTHNQFNRISDVSLRAFDEYASLVDSIGVISDFIDLSQIDAETIIINSEDDPIVDSYDIEEVTDSIETKEIKIIKSAGHFLHLEDKSIFEIYEDFLDSKKNQQFNRYGAAYLKYRDKNNDE